MPLVFQDIIAKLNQFWASQGCVIVSPLDVQVGAGTFHPATFLRSLGSKPWQAAYLQPSRRPTDGRYGDNPNRLQHYFQYQVLIKPSVENIIDLYLESLELIGIDRQLNDIRLVEDNWESATLGANGLGWEVWINGMEVTQFTYFQQCGGFQCSPVSVEITYGLERLAMYVQEVENVYDLLWCQSPHGRKTTYGDLFRLQEQQQSSYNFDLVDTKSLFSLYTTKQKIATDMIDNTLAIPAYENLLDSIHLFNVLDARYAISITERQKMILEIRQLAHLTAKAWLLATEPELVEDLKDKA